MEKLVGCIELFLFFALLIGRVAMMNKRGIKAFVFGGTDKSDFLLMPVMLLLAYSVIANAFGLPIPFADVINKPFWSEREANWTGVLLAALGLISFSMCLKSFGDSFRVGIDVNKPDKLVTTGMFKYSRNPIYVSFFAFFIGQWLINPTILMLIMVLVFVAAIHRQVLREEKFLRTHYGDEYTEYCRKVRRYL